MKKKTLLVASLLLSATLSINAQGISKDEQKRKQWQSMENGPWDFAPDWYYYFLHKSYSGAEMYWKWAGFKSGYRVRFKESKSNVKRIMPVRVVAEETERQKDKKAEEERTQIKELYDEDLARAADRNVDLMYSSFRANFDRMQQSISEGLLYCLQRSRGKLKPQVDRLTNENEIICQNIAYIHRTGVGHELENAKREQAYLEYKRQMEKMVSRVAHLVGMAKQFY
ncbi:hypothetical protein IX307_001630 [Bacteroides pyogenes]|uniref:DUF5045 domain-containing protein n=1 Tax=Bacteroides pyogenes TaxID=310300 RepID=UPI001BAAD9C3|nr:DUF5045 domain-containing protein [Bacteroides pyogenes]MBR8726227.1 hypothetical protein [Bacteroides pyogenes]MBR8739514.1 hypothetical protein [Bacteroides pyogenes]MBR8755338.1 hypothetical protein [Bacteroides pyogenes]MBR8787305.1 hypothetical protein [Bacteroides pyogenes]MBR8792831.1 hypothetical protein [Bacteroides pyogenes]